MHASLYVIIVVYRYVIDGVNISSTNVHARLCACVHACVFGPLSLINRICCQESRVCVCVQYALSSAILLCARWITLDCNTDSKSCHLACPSLKMDRKQLMLDTSVG